MSTIHSISSVLALPQYDIFGVPPTQLTVEKDIQTEYRPISTITNSTSPIEFEIRSGYNEYINLSKSELHLQLQISLSKTNMAKEQAITTDDWKKICPVNYLLNSFFKHISIEINKSLVTSSSSLNYAYISYFDALLNFPEDSKKTVMKTSFWYPDTQGKMDEINVKRSSLISPNGNNLENSCVFELYGNLHIDLASQMKSLIGGLTLGITLFPNDPKFYLMHDSLLVPKVTIRDIRLNIHKSIVTPQVQIAHMKVLNNANARYFITRKEVRSFILQKGSIDCYLDNVENGVLPRKLFIGLVSNEAFNGSPKLNPFNFKNYSLRHIACFFDGVQYPSRAFTPDFANNHYYREYFGLFEATNQVRPTTNIQITLEDYKNGYTIYGFNFIPDLSDGVSTSGYTSAIKQGNLRMELKFSHPLIESVSAIIFCEYDNLIEIPVTREAIKNFN